MHHHRREDQEVVFSTEKVTNGGKAFLMSENEVSYISLGIIHAIENPGKLPFKVIGVQPGPHHVEEVIVRFNDTYGIVPD